MKYVDTPEYQAEIATQYKQRNLQIEPTDVQEILAAFGFKVPLESIVMAHAGNMNATFIASAYVIKINHNPEETKYAANVIVSEALPNSKVIRTVVHDEYTQTNYEVLIMEKAPGAMWLGHMPEMTEEENTKLFAAVLDVVNECRTIHHTEKFGWVTDIIRDADKNGFDSFSEQLASRLDSYLEKLRQITYLDQEKIMQIETYIRRHLHLFATDTASFVHTDLHMGNVMQQNGELAAVIDFDSVRSAPAYTTLTSLIGLIDNPAQYVEGTPDYEAYKGKKFEYLYPILKEKLGDLLEEENLGLKLNVLGMIDGLMWASEQWSEQWTQELIHNLVENEIVEDGDYSGTYYAPIVERIKNS